MTTGTNRKPLRVTIRQAEDAIRRRDSFVAGDGSLSTERQHYEPSRGRLSADLWQQLTDLWHATPGDGLYVVYSYGTPIAWAPAGEPLTVPDVRYSVTTSRHQGIARRAD